MRLLSGVIKIVAGCFIAAGLVYFVLSDTIHDDGNGMPTDMLGREVQKRSFISRLFSGEEYGKGPIEQWIDVLITGGAVGVGVILWRAGSKIERKGEKKSIQRV